MCVVIKKTHKSFVKQGGLGLRDRENSSFGTSSAGEDSDCRTVAENLEGFYFRHLISWRSWRKVEDIDGVLAGLERHGTEWG